jgi:hypothetical protein
MIITAPMSVAATKPPPQATEREKLMLEESDDAQTMAAVYRRLGIGLTVKWAGIALMCIGAGRRRAIRRARLDAGLSASGA